MIGIYDRTVILTYLSFTLAICGCVAACAGAGHPYIGGFLLLVCGLCDTFDGRVARRKANRTEREKCFGGQIDSLSDLAAFGILPAALAIGLLMNEGIFTPSAVPTDPAQLLTLIPAALIILFYCLAALIRLAFFNTLDEERRHSNDTSPQSFVGVPVTVAALVFPCILILNAFLPFGLAALYLTCMLILGLLFLAKIHINKPGLKGIIVMVVLGAAEFVLMLLLVI